MIYSNSWYCFQLEHWCSGQSACTSWQIFDLDNGCPQHPRRPYKYVMYGYGNASLSPKGPSRTGSISALGVVPARTTSSGGIQRGKVPAETLGCKRSQVSLVGSLLILFQNIFLFFLILYQIPAFRNNKKLSRRSTNWAMKTIVNIVIFITDIIHRN